jgi:hypothetical protein
VTAEKDDDASEDKVAEPEAEEVVELDEDSVEEKDEH